MNQHREMSILDDSDFIAPTPESPTSPPAIEITPENQLQFILKKGRKMHNKGLSRIIQFISFITTDGFRRKMMIKLQNYMLTLQPQSCQD